MPVAASNLMRCPRALVRVGVGALIAGVALGGCSAVTSARPTPGLTIRPRSVVIPGEVRTLTAARDGLLVGSYDATVAIRPRLSLLPTDGSDLREIALHPAPGYGAESQWLSVASHAGQVTAIGGAPGGAHSNTRWTVWQGDSRGLTEQPQGFNTFGGEDAGGLVGVVYAGDTPVLVGSWHSASTGLDIAVWRRRGLATWVRDSSTGTPLASTPTSLVQAQGASSAGTDVLVVGSTTELPTVPGRGSVEDRATAWRGSIGADGRWSWSVVALPGGSTGRAEAVACDEAGAECVVLGRRAGLAVAWVIDGGRVAGPEPLGGLLLTEGDRLVAPVEGPNGWYAAVRRRGATPQGGTVQSGTPQGGTVVGRDRDGWHTTADLSTTPTALAQVNGLTFLATSPANGVQLWEVG